MPEHGRSVPARLTIANPAACGEVPASTHLPSSPGHPAHDQPARPASITSPVTAAATGGQGRRAGSGSRCDDGRVTEHAASAAVTAEDEVAGLCSDLIRIDTSNYGDHSGSGERPAAEHVAALLAGVGLEPVVLESHPGRASVVTRLSGEDPSRPALLIHGHLDVVPADAADWAVHPFSGEIVDGTIWGRGAVDMKDMDAMMLAVVRQRMREGRRPPRDNPR